MSPPVELTDEDLKLAEGACRANAARCQRKGVNEEAATWAHLADKVANAHAD